MAKRHNLIGIKQVVRLEWYDYALDLLLSGAGAEEVRYKLDDLISERNQSGGYGERGEQTYVKAVTQIMNTWVKPARELLPLRNDLADLMSKTSKQDRILGHWAMTSAAYPFWSKVAEQVGRLLNLQETITQSQIRSRCFERLGERTTIERSARRVVRTFIEWGVIEDAGTRGNYRKGQSLEIADTKTLSLVFEALLHTIPQASSPLPNLKNCPALFPFKIPVATGDSLCYSNPRLQVHRYGLDEEVLMLAQN